MNTYIPKTLDEYLEILFKRRKQILVPFLLVLAGTAVSYPFLPRLYSSSCLLLAQDEEMIDPLLKGIAVKPSIDKKFKTVSSQILSWPNLTLLVRRLQLDQKITEPEDLEKMIKGIKDRIEIKMVTNELVRIYFEDKDPETAQRVVEVLSENFVEQGTTKKRQESAQAINFIEEQLKIYKEKLSSSEGSFFVNKVRSDLDEAVKRRRLVGDQVAQLERTVTKEVIREQNPVAMKLRQDLTEARIQLSRLQVDAKEGNPIVEELTQRIADIERRLAQEKDNVISSETSMTNPAYQAALMEQKELDLQIASLTKRLSDMQSGHFRLKDASEQELRGMERDKQVNEDIYKSLLVRLENAQISKRLGDEGQGDNVEIVEPARLPTIPIKPKPDRVMLMGFMAALAAGFGLVFLLEQLDGSIRGINDAKSAIKVPLLGAIPRMVVRSDEWQFPDMDKARQARRFFGVKPGQNGAADLNIFPYVANPIPGSEVSPQIVAYHDPKSIPAEHYRLLRTHLLYMKWKSPLKTLLLTSSMEGEGKSTTAVNLAVSMAKEVSDSVLLLDCDLRKGSVAQALGLSNATGLSDVLQGKKDLDSALVKSSVIPYLTVLPSGPSVFNSTELLGSRHMKSLMAALRGRFEFIIMDAAPTLGLSDVPVLIPESDGVLLIVQSGRTHRQVVADTLTTIQGAHQGNVLGFVLTHVDSALPKGFHKYVPGVYYQGYYAAGAYAAPSIKQAG